MQSVQISSHPSIYLLWMAIVRQILMVHKYHYLVRQANQQVSIMFEFSYDGEELSVPDIVISFCRVQGL